MSAISRVAQVARGESGCLRPARRWSLDSLSWLAPKVPLRQVISILDASQEALAEEFRLLQMRLEWLRERRQLRTILVASSVPGEGRSFVTVNLAAAMAQGGRNKVLVVEANLRRPWFCSALGVDELAGLADYCSSAGPAERFAYRVTGVDFCLLPAGRVTGAPLEVLASSGMRQLLEDAGEEFDWVLVDSPPLLPVADSALLARLCDGVVLVVRRRQALQAGVREALERIEPAKVLGVALNDFPVASSCSGYFKRPAEARASGRLNLVDDREAA